MNQQIAITEKGLTTKLEMSLDRIRTFEPRVGYYLAFSGGKDSITCYHLLKMAGVKFDAHYNNTTVDPPELIRFIRKEYPDVEWNKPEMTMWKLIEKKRIPPTRFMRYCCKELKEGGGKGRTVVTGARWAESSKRAKRKDVEFDVYGSRTKEAIKRKDIFLQSDNLEKRRMIETCQIRGQNIVNPIIDWEDWEVWSFIKSNGIKYPSLYDEGFDRLGCIGCPLAGPKQMKIQLDRWPRYKSKYINAFQKMIDKRKKDGLKTEWETGEEVMDWWLSR